MAQPAIQTSFASGEWAPKLRSRVDIQKYRAGAALLRNFYVDFAGGGASTRSGTQFINQVFKSSTPVRLIPFQPSSGLSYVLEFGDGYIRFHSNGAPIIEAATTISGVTNANPGVITDAAHGYSNGQWVFLSGIGGTVQLNNNYYIVQGVTANTFTLTDLNGNVVNTTTFGAYTSGGQAQRVYTLASPFAASDLFPNPITNNPGIKFAQDVTSMIFCHPSYQPQILTINAPTNWTISTINFGVTIATPTSVIATTTLTVAANSWSYGYAVTAVDVNGQESIPSATVTLLNYQSLQSNAGTNIVSWASVTGAVSYNVYKLTPIFNTVFPVNAPSGFIGNTSALSFTDSNPGFLPDFSQTPPVAQNPFLGAGVQSFTVTAPGTYTTVPSVTIGAPPAGGSQATAQVQLGIVSSSISSAGNGFTVGQIYNVIVGSIAIATIRVTAVGVSNAISTYVIVWPGSISVAGTTTPPNPLQVSNPGGANATINATWGVVAVNLIQPGSGYLSAPSVTFSAGAAAATAVLNPSGGGNPGVPEFFQERLVLAAQKSAVQAVNMSQPGSFFNFNVSFPIEDDDGISTQIISSELNDIRSLTQVPSGLLALTGKAGWLINGGGGLATAAPITPTTVTAQAQGFNGASDIRPLKVNMDVLYVTNKGNYVRDLAFNIYANIFTGTDISVISNHLFFGTYLTQWAWSEEPFKTAWAIRDDGVVLSLAYVKDQELIGWAHHDTNGQFTSVASVIELDGTGDTVDAVYFVVQRQLPNGTYVKYVERMSNRYFPYGYEDSWSVDCALQTKPTIPSATAAPLGNLIVSGNASAVGNSVTLTDTVGAQFTVGMVNSVVRSGGGKYLITGFTSSSVVSATVQRVPSTINPYTNIPQPWPYSVWAPVTVVGGLTQLIGQQVTGVADGAVVPLTTVSASGTVTLSQAATKVTLGLPFTPQLQTLPLDLGEPTVQSKRKKVPAATMRVADTLGLQIGTTFGNLVTVKDFQIGAIPTQSNGVAMVTDLFAGDGRQILDQVWQEIGQLCVQQNLPYPATILGIMPEVTVGDSPEPGRGRQ